MKRNAGFLQILADCEAGQSGDWVHQGHMIDGGDAPYLDKKNAASCEGDESLQAILI